MLLEKTQQIQPVAPFKTNNLHPIAVAFSVLIGQKLLRHLLSSQRFIFLNSSLKRYHF